MNAGQWFFLVLIAFIVFALRLRKPPPIPSLKQLSDWMLEQHLRMPPQQPYRPVIPLYRNKYMTVQYEKIEDDRGIGEMITCHPIRKETMYGGGVKLFFANDKFMGLVHLRGERETVIDLSELIHQEKWSASKILMHVREAVALHEK